MPVEEALALAQEKSLDLVEVAPNGKPVVCKMLDYGKYSYHEKKKRTEARAKVRVTTTKMVKFRPNTFEGDYKVKMNRIRKFLGMGDKVKVVMQFRGREIIHAQNGYQLFRRIAGEIEGDGTVDAEPTSEGRFIHMVLAPAARAKEPRRPVNGETSEVPIETGEREAAPEPAGAKAQKAQPAQGKAQG